MTARREARREKVFRAIRRAFVWSCKASILSLLGLVALFVIDGIWPGSIGDLMMLETPRQLVLGLAVFIFVAMVPALVPFISLAYMVSAIFGAEAGGRKELGLMTFAIFSGAFALILAIEDNSCLAAGVDPGACLGAKLAFIANQFSKGGFGDIFDIYDMNFEGLDLQTMSGVAKIYVLNFRMLSGAYLAALLVALFSREGREDPAPEAEPVVVPAADPAPANPDPAPLVLTRPLPWLRASAPTGDPS